MEFLILVLIMFSLLLLSQWRHHRAIRKELTKTRVASEESLKESRKTRKVIDDHISENKKQVEQTKKAIKKYDE